MNLEATFEEIEATIARIRHLVRLCEAAGAAFGLAIHIRERAPPSCGGHAVMAVVDRFEDRTLGELISPTVSSNVARENPRSLPFQSRELLPFLK
jgi:hypothetical protein